MGVHSDPTGSSTMANNTKNLRGQLGLRSSALAPTSSKLTTQYMVMDHMKNHYNKITNAKPAIDNRAPKSISTSQKVRDRNTRDGKRRPVSAMSVNYPVRPYSAMTGHDVEDFYDEDQWGDVDPEDEVERQVREIMRKKLNTRSVNEIHSIHATHAGTSQSPYYSARMEQTSHRRPASARPSARSVHSGHYIMDRTAMPTKTIAQKTYDGDVIEKHNHVFTQPEKPFTPRVLKSNRVSRIAQSKYYTAPPQKRETNESTNAKELKSPTPKPRAKPRMNAPVDKSGDLTETLMFESLQSRDFSRYSDEREQVVPRLDISLDKDNMNWIKEQAMKAEIRAKSGSLRTGMSRINEDQMLDSADLEQTDRGTLTGGSLNKTTRSFGTKTLHNSQRLNTDFNNLKKPVKGKREEELQYVEFIKEVTDDVLNRGVFTDRVLKQVFESHIAKKKGKLNEEKMRSMLSQVRQDLDIKDESESADFSPLNTSSSMGSRLHTRYSRGKTGEQGFGSTMDSQNTYNFRDTSSGDMFSTIHSENDDLSATQALKNYQLDITKHEENEDGNESPGEIVGSDEENGKSSLVHEDDDKSVKSAKSSQSAHSSVHNRSVKSGKSSGHPSVTSSNRNHDAHSVKSGRSQYSQKSEGFKPSAKPRATSHIDDVTESSENQSTLRGEEDEDDEYEDDDNF